MFVNTSFIFDDISSNNYNVGIYTINGTNNHSTNDEKTTETISKSVYCDTWDLHNVAYDEPLKFNVTLCKNSKDGFTIQDEIAIKKWLCRNTRKILQIEHDDFYGVRFNCRFTNPREEIFGANMIGLTFTVICDSPYGWSDVEEYSFSSTTTNSIMLLLDTQFADKCIYPVLTINNASGTIKIKNITTNEETVIANCISSETITLNCIKDMIETTSAHNVISDWNKISISLIDGENELLLTGSFTVEIKYITPVRVGGL